VVGDLRAIHCAGEDVVTNAARMLPRSACPESAYAALVMLDHFNKHLAPLSLRAFLNSVLMDLRVCNELLICPASLRNYRPYPGGLLAHAVAVMQLCETLCSGRLQPLELATTQVAALIDQIDRMRVIRACELQPSDDALFDRGARSNQMLDFHLSGLRREAPEVAQQLAATLSYLARPNSRKEDAPSLAAEIARDANRFAVTQIDPRRSSERARKVLPFQDYRLTLDGGPSDLEPS